MPRRIATLFRIVIPYAVSQFKQIADHFDQVGIRVLFLSWVTCYDQDDLYRVIDFVTSNPDAAGVALGELGYEYLNIPLCAAPLIENAGDLYKFAQELGNNNQIMAAQLPVPADFTNHYLAIGFHPEDASQGRARLEQWKLAARPVQLQDIGILSFPCPREVGAVSSILAPVGTQLPDLVIPSLIITDCYTERRVLLVVTPADRDEVISIYEDSGLRYYEFDAYALVVQREGGTHFIRSLAEMIGDLLIERMMTYPRDRLVARSAYATANGCE